MSRQRKSRMARPALRHAAARGASAPAVAVIGCGAIAERFHLPALARHPDVRRRLVLVDPDLDRARSLAARFGVTRVAERLEDVLDAADAAVIATPHELHYPLARACLEAGLAVLCEKPLAHSAHAARELAETAERRGVGLYVNQSLRLYPTFELLKRWTSSGALGTLRRVRVYWGEKFDWPAASGFYFTGGTRGVLLDKGPHVLDLLCWWLDEPPSLVDYRDDSLGGPEATARLRLAWADGAGEAEIQLSWLVTYENTYDIEGTLARVRGHLYDWTSLVLERNGRSRKVRPRTRMRTAEDLARHTIDDFLRAARNGPHGCTPAAEVLPSLGLIEQCYAQRTRFDMPWYDALERLRDDD